MAGEWVARDPFAMCIAGISAGSGGKRGGHASDGSDVRGAIRFEATTVTSRGDSAGAAGVIGVAAGGAVSAAGAAGAVVFMTGEASRAWLAQALIVSDTTNPIETIERGTEGMGGDVYGIVM